MNDKFDDFLNYNLTDFMNLLNGSFNPSIVNKQYDTIVHVLCRSGSITLDILKLFLTHFDFDPNIKNENDATIFNILCINENIDKDIKYQMMINILEHPKFRVNGIRILHDACTSENIRLIRLLLCNEQINSNNHPIEPFHLSVAISTYRIEILQLILENHHNIVFPDASFLAFTLSLDRESVKSKNLSDDEILNFIKVLHNHPQLKHLQFHNNLIFCAIQTGDVRLLEISLRLENITINIKQFETDLIIQKNVFRILSVLKKDGRFDSQIFGDDNSLYHIAFAGHGIKSIDQAKLVNNFLMEWQINPFIKNDCDETVFHLICRKGLYMIFMDLYNKYPNLDVNMTNDEKNTLLHLAVVNRRDDDTQSQSRSQLIKFLVSHTSIDLTKLNDCKQNIFHMACMYPNIEILKFLIEEINLPDSVINGIDHSGLTPINSLFDLIKSCVFYECISDYMPSIEYLLTIKRINFLQADNDNHSPFDYISKKYRTRHQSCIKHYNKIKKYMIENIEGINVDVDNKNLIYE